MSTPVHVLTFTADGLGHGLYTEVVELKAIGTLFIRRATTIEFNEEAQQWDVRTPGGELLYRHHSRAVCLAWENQYFN